MHPLVVDFVRKKGMSKQSNIPVDKTKQNHKIESLGLIDAWFTTNRSCQNRCSFCYAQDTKFNKNLNMQPELASKLIDIPTVSPPSENYRPAIKILRSIFEGFGFKCEEIIATRSNKT